MSKKQSLLETTGMSVNAACVLTNHTLLLLHLTDWKIHINFNETENYYKKFSLFEI